MESLVWHECYDINCRKIGVYEDEDGNLSCEKHKDSDMVFKFDIEKFDTIPIFDMNKKYRICIYRDCEKHATWNFFGETKRLFCAAHKLDTMVNLAARMCACGKTRPSFANAKLGETKLGEVRPTHCKSCKLPTMVDVVSKKCVVCRIKQPTFCKLDEDKPTHCGDCKDDDMVDAKHHKCVCGTRAHYAYRGEKTPTHCGNCKLENMIDVTSPECVVCGKTHPIFANPGETKPTHCGGCKLDDMVDVKNPKCVECGLTIPSFAKPGETTPTHCGTCKSHDMMDVKGQKCIVCSIKSPSFGYPGEKATHCFDCKLPTMDNVTSPRCVNGCGVQINNFNNKYDGYCTRCFVYTFPDATISRNYRIKEKHFTDFVKQKFPDLNITYDRRIQNGCSLKRPDIFIDCGTHVIIGECDENGHRYTLCETKRMMELFVDAGSLRMVMLRLNPDGFVKKNNQKISSCFKVCKKTGILIVADKKKWRNRLDVFCDRLRYYVNNIPEKEITIEHLFYDGD